MGFKIDERQSVRQIYEETNAKCPDVERLGAEICLCELFGCVESNGPGFDGHGEVGFWVFWEKGCTSKVADFYGWLPFFLISGVCRLQAHQNVLMLEISMRDVHLIV